jgi:hypothetical protein
MTDPAHPPKAAPLIACLNSSQPLVDLLRDLLVSEGWRAATHVQPVTGIPQVSIDFLAGLRPDVVVYAISPPYEQGWADYIRVRQALPECRFVLTTTNKQALESFVGPTPAVEIIGKPFDIEEFIEAVRCVLPVATREDQR